MAQAVRPTAATYSRPNDRSPYAENRSAGDDSRLTQSQRIDQRYQNFTYGADQDYAQNRANTFQNAGTDAAGQFRSMGVGATGNADAARDRTAPETQFGAANATLGQGGSLYNRLTAFADAPAGPSAAQAQLQKGSDQAMAANLALAGSGRGMGDSAEAMRRAQFANAGQQATLANDSAILRAQEDQARQQNVLQAYGQGAGLLNQQAQTQAGMAQYLSDQELQNRSLNDQTALSYDQMGLDAYGQGIQGQLAYEQEARANLENELQANMGYEDLTMQGAGIRQQKNLQDDQQDFDRDTQVYGAALGLASSAGGMALTSDERSKKRIRELERLNDEYAALSE
jgi:hypothetical protein